MTTWACGYGRFQIAKIPWHLEYSLERYLWRRRAVSVCRVQSPWHLEYSFERSLWQRISCRLFSHQVCFLLFKSGFVVEESRDEALMEGVCYHTADSWVSRVRREQNLLRVYTVARAWNIANANIFQIYFLYYAAMQLVAWSQWGIYVSA